MEQAHVRILHNARQRAQKEEENWLVRNALKAQDGGKGRNVKTHVQEETATSVEEDTQ